MIKRVSIIVAVLILGLSLAACSLTNSMPRQMPSRDMIVPGQTITVKGNESVYAVARENDVSMRELIVLNNLQSPFTLHPGQSLTLPANKLSAQLANGYVPPRDSYLASGATAPPPAAMPSGAIEAVPLAPIEVAPLGSSKSEPKPNAITAQPLSSPAAAGLGTLNQPQSQPKAVATTTSNTKGLSQAGGTQSAPPSSNPSPAPTPPSASAAAPAAETAAAAASSAPAPKINMVWPVQGPIVSAFGSKGQGLNNDGINIGAPKGAPVIAAANGIVVYAGSEMKGFGNLVLVRHQDGWVTAYAHLDRMLVAKDGVVAQGDMIGTVGKTGNVPSPQLHFETRYEGKPVDPTTVIKTQ